MQGRRRDFTLSVGPLALGHGFERRDITDSGGSAAPGEGIVVLPSVNPTIRVGMSVTVAPSGPGAARPSSSCEFARHGLGSPGATVPRCELSTSRAVGGRGYEGPLPSAALVIRQGSPLDRIGPPGSRRPGAACTLCGSTVCSAHRLSPHSRAQSARRCCSCRLVQPRRQRWQAGRAAPAAPPGQSVSAHLEPRLRRGTERCRAPVAVGGSRTRSGVSPIRPCREPAPAGGRAMRRLVAPARTRSISPFPPRTA